LSFIFLYHDALMLAVNSCINYVKWLHVVCGPLSPVLFWCP